MLFSSQVWHSDWRNDHYAVDLDWILEISKNLDRPHLSECVLKDSPQPSVLAVIHQEQPILDSPMSLSSTSVGAMTLDSSPTSIMSWTSANSLLTTEVNSNTTSPTAISQGSISPTSPGFNAPTASVVRCLACSKEFKGSLQDANSNLRRHLRTSSRHNKRAGLKCPQPECRNKHPMRSDNLVPHLLNVHNITPLSERQRIKKDCKLSAMSSVDSDGIPRRRSRRE